MVKELIQLIRKQIGPVAAFQNVLIVEKLPETESLNTQYGMETLFCKLLVIRHRK